MEGFSFSFGLDRNSSAGGVMLFVRDKILSKHLKPYFNPSKQSYSKVWISRNTIAFSFSEILMLKLQTLSIFSEFCETTNLKSLVKEPICFKSLENPTSIDLILTNRLKCLQNSKCF